MPGFDSIPGQAKAVFTLRAFLASGNIPHAIILSGIPGTGKQTAATLFAMAANCRGEEDAGGAGLPCANCRSCRTIKGERHPDVHHLRPDRKVIKVDQIRQLRAAIAMKPFEAKTRAVIVHDAHTMNPAAANALLKSLEEPPPDTVFLLLTDQPGRMLPTVLSRCQTIRFTPVAEDEIRRHLTDACHLPRSDAAVIARLSGGSMSAAEKMANPGWQRHRRFVLDIMARIDTLPPAMLIAVAARIVESPVPIPETLTIMETWIRDGLTAGVAPDRLINVDLSDKIQYSASRTPAEAALYRARAVLLARRRLDGNANVKLTVEHLLIDMAAAERRHRMVEI